MLDIEHPQTRHVFAVARVEEEIRARLIAARSLAVTERSERMKVILAVLIPKLHFLNRAHFGDSPVISATLRRLEESVREGDVDESWQRFLALAERHGDNFGTWAI